jgi:hypothetical protein
MFDFQPSEKKEVLEKYFNQEDGLSLVLFPKKQKQKYLCLLWIKDLFSPGKIYTEREVNEILKKVYPDFVMIRRYLIDYHLLYRKADGSSYWKNLEVENE